MWSLIISETLPVLCCRFSFCCTLHFVVHFFLWNLRTLFALKHICMCFCQHHMLKNKKVLNSCNRFCPKRRRRCLSLMTSNIECIFVFFLKLISSSPTIIQAGRVYWLIFFCVSLFWPSTYLAQEKKSESDQEMDRKRMCGRYSAAAAAEVYSKKSRKSEKNCQTDFWATEVVVSDDVVSAAMIGARKDLFFFSSFLLFVQQCNLAFAITNLAGWLAPTARLLHLVFPFFAFHWLDTQSTLVTVVVAVAGNEQGSVLCLCLCVCKSILPTNSWFE